MLLIGSKYKKMIGRRLDDLGASVFWLPDNPDVDRRLAGHADLSVFAANDSTVVAARGIYTIVNKLTKRGYSIIPSGDQGTAYPDDAGLCICMTEKYTIYNPKTIDPVVKPYLRGTMIEVSQGYTKCSVCVVSDEAIITSDDLIASRAANAGMDVLQIVPGHIILEGFETGFIGGASFTLNKKELAFTGMLDEHPDKEHIITFLRKHGVKPVFLTDDPIFDIGGAVALP